MNPKPMAKMIPFPSIPECVDIVAEIARRRTVQCSQVVHRRVQKRVHHIQGWLTSSKGENHSHDLRIHLSDKVGLRSLLISIEQHRGSYRASPTQWTTTSSTWTMPQGSCLFYMQQRRGPPRTALTTSLDSADASHFNVG